LKSTDKKSKCQHLKKQLCQTKLREIQNNWWEQKAEELQNFADARDLRSFYEGTKAIYRPTKSSTGTLMSADNSILLTYSQVIFDRWKEHFNILLNKTSTAAEDFLRNVPAQPPEPWMPNLSTFQEFTKAMIKMCP